MLVPTCVLLMSVNLCTQSIPHWLQRGRDMAAAVHHFGRHVYIKPGCMITKSLLCWLCPPLCWSHSAAARGRLAGSLAAWHW